MVSLGVLKLPPQTNRDNNPSQQLKEDTERCLHSRRIISQEAQQDRSENEERQSTSQRNQVKPQIAAFTVKEDRRRQTSTVKAVKKKKRFDTHDNLVSTEEDEALSMLGFGQKQNKIRISVGSNEDAELKPVQKRETQELPVTLLDLPQVAGEAGDSK